jgi:hypothetical protein
MMAKYARRDLPGDLCRSSGRLESEWRGRGENRRSLEVVIERLEVDCSTSGEKLQATDEKGF